MFPEKGKDCNRPSKLEKKKISGGQIICGWSVRLRSCLSPLQVKASSTVSKDRAFNWSSIMFWNVASSSLFSDRFWSLLHKVMKVAPFQNRSDRFSESLKCERRQIIGKMKSSNLFFTENDWSGRFQMTVISLMRRLWRLITSLRGLWVMARYKRERKGLSWQLKLLNLLHRPGFSERSGMYRVLWWDWNRSPHPDPFNTDSVSTGKMQQ